MNPNNQPFTGAPTPDVPPTPPVAPSGGFPANTQPASQHSAPANSNYAYAQQPVQPFIPAPPSATPPPRQHQHQAAESRGSILSTIAIIILAPVVALLLTMFVFQSYQVDGDSMVSTLHNKDRLIVLKAPVTLAHATDKQYVPHRGDVIVFDEGLISGERDSGVDKQLIKRVIGLPGERVRVENNVVTVFNKEHPDGFNPDKTMPYGNVIKETNGNVDYSLGENQIFVLGDNRGNSLDSRALGPVNTKAIVGKLLVRVWPAQDVKLF